MRTGSLGAACRIALTFWALACGAGLAHAIDFAAPGERADTGGAYQYLLDPGQSFTLEQALARAQWKRGEPDRSGRGITRDAVWMRFTLSNTGATPETRLLQYVDSKIGRIELHRITPGALPAPQVFDLSEPVAARPYVSVYPVFPVTLAPGETREFVARLTSPSGTGGPLFTRFEIWRPGAFELHSQRELAFLVAFASLCLMMAAATLIVFMVIREPSFLYYAFYAATTAVSFSVLDGLWLLLVDSGGTTFNRLVPAISLHHLAIYLFVRSFLDTASVAPKMDLLLRGAIVLAISGLVAIAFGYVEFTIHALELSALAFPLLVIVGLVCWRRGVPGALLFSVSWAAYVIGAATYPLRDLGVLEHGFFSAWMAQIGAAVEVILLTTLMTGRLLALRRDRERLRALFEQFASPEVARELERDPTLLEGREREVTVLIADLRGYTTIAERLGPLRSHQLLQAVMDRLTDRVIEHGGVIIDYSGDGLLAMWNAPIEQADNAARACRAAIAMQGEMPGLNGVWSVQIGRELGLGIGVHSGIAEVGNAGSARRLKYGPRGHSVNLAARVEGATKQVGVPVLITGATRAKLPVDVPCRRAGTVRMVGVTEPVELYALHCGAVDANWNPARAPDSVLTLETK